ncbi:hypothetical protein [Granulicella arctica]|uniref:hypothetical protein n=1 Tax=Granulicella arctica TaxID=940613 RepID=UPI0021E0A481|nr:hypothetical protein [Granulicella arctica]
MKLVVSGLDNTRDPLRFRHLWGRYVLGVKPWKHCLEGLKTEVAKDVLPDMKDGEYELEDRLFYLCGVGHAESKARGLTLNRKVTNVHLAVRPREGSVASIGSVYGVTFTIKGAHAIPIEPLPKDFGGLPPEHYRCKNFQFGYQTFDVETVGDAAEPKGVITRLRNNDD